MAGSIVQSITSSLDNEVPSRDEEGARQTSKALSYTGSNSWTEGLLFDFDMARDGCLIFLWSAINRLSPYYSVEVRWRRETGLISIT